MELLKKQKPISLADLRWGLRGNKDLLDKLECIKYYKTSKKVEKIHEKIKDKNIEKSTKDKLLMIKDIDTLKKAIEVYNKFQCMSTILKFKRPDLIRVYKEVLKWSNNQIEELRDQAPKSSSLSAVGVVLKGKPRGTVKKNIYNSTTS